MFSNEFLSRYEDRFEYYIDEDYNYDNHELIRLTYDKLMDVPIEVILEVDEERLSLYKEYIFEDFDSIIQTCITQRYQLVTLVFLYNRLGNKPECWVEDSMGCPFISENVGYYNLPIDWDEIDGILDAYSNLELISNDQIFDLVKMSLEIFPDNYLQYEENIEQINKSISVKLESKGFLKGIDLHLKPNNNLQSFIYDTKTIWVNDSQTSMIGYGFDELNKILSLMGGKKYEIKKTHEGFHNFIAQTDEMSICYSIEYIRLFNEITIENDTGEHDIEHVIISGNRFLLSTFDSLWQITCPMSGDIKVHFIKEINSLKEMDLSLRALVPGEIIKSTHDYSGISAEQFELLCGDILKYTGYSNVIIRGTSTAADGGVDIEADEIIDGLRRHWIFQCKHTKKQLNRKDLSEVPDLILEFNAFGYGIFYSGIFTPQTITRINTQKNKGVQIKHWDKNEIDSILYYNHKVAQRFFGLSANDYLNP